MYSPPVTFVIADLLFRLHGWPTTQTLMSVFVIIIGCYTAIDWINDIIIFINILSSLFNIAHSTAIDRQLRLHSRLSLLPSVIITAGCVCRHRLLSCFAWLMDFCHCHRWASTSLPPAYLCRRPWCLRFHSWLIMPLLMGDTLIYITREIYQSGAYSYACYTHHIFRVSVCIF